MDQSVFMSPTKCIHSERAEARCGMEMEKYGRTALLVYEASIRRTDLYQRVCDALKDAGVACFELGDMGGPDLSLARRGVDLCRVYAIESVLAVGGGNTINVAKAIGVGAVYVGDVWDFFSGRAVPERTLPVGVVLTAPASGGEVNGRCVLHSGVSGEAAELLSDVLRPKFALSNPESARSAS